VLGLLQRPHATATSRGLLSGILQLRASTPELAVAVARTGTAWGWVDSPQVATTDSGNGGWLD
jgi:hypothetical protein